MKNGISQRKSPRGATISRHPSPQARISTDDTPDQALLPQRYKDRPRMLSRLSRPSDLELLLPRISRGAKIQVVQWTLSLDAGGVTEGSRGLDRRETPRTGIGGMEGHPGRALAGWQRARTIFWHPCRRAAEPSFRFPGGRCGDPGYHLRRLRRQSSLGLRANAPARISRCGLR
jgi:hypothetical protein